MTAFDVVIVGAGPAGSSAAYHLARCGHEVVLLERQSFPRDKACGDGLTREAVELLTEMGLGDELAPYRQVHGVRITTDTKGYRDSRYHRLGPERPDYGVVVPRKELDHLICQAAVEAGAVLWERTTVTDAAMEHGRVCGVKARQNGVGTEIPATFVVAADGSNSHLARRLGLVDKDRWSTGYALRGYFTDIVDVDDLLIVYVPLIDPEGNRAVAGYGWVFPLRGTEANIGVGFFPSQEQDFEVNLRHLFDHFVADLRQRDKRFAEMKMREGLRGAPLHAAMNPSQCSGEGILVVGDAAGLVNPFTGEGINSALESGKLASQVLHEALNSPNPTGADLAQYSRLLEERYSDLFRTGRKFVKIYGFMWKLLESTFDIDRPLFTSFRHAMMDYGTDDDPYISPGFLRASPWVEEMALVNPLLQVQDLIGEIIRADFPLLSRVSSDLLNVGSLLRPTLLFLSAHFGDPENPACVPAATSVELARLASALHSDVLDGGPPGEGSPSQGPGRGINWGNMFAVMAGDYLLAQSHGLAADIDHQVSQMISRAVADVSAGRIRAAAQAGSLQVSEGRYLDTLGKMTATFYELPCRLGAKLSGAPEEVIAPLSAYGRRLGMAFQLANEVRDVLTEEDVLLEHPVAQPLQMDTYTLPMVHSLSGRDNGEFRHLLHGSATGEAQIEAALTLLRGNGSLSSTREKAADFADEAKTSLNSLPNIPAKGALAALATSVVEGVEPAQ